MKIAKINKIKFSKGMTIISILIIGFFVLIVGFLVVGVFSQSTFASSLPFASDNRTDVEKAKAEETLNKNLTIPLKDKDGKQVSKLDFVLQNAELRDQIIVKGERATTVKGRTFLILNIKITDEYDKAIKMNVRDFVRLGVNGSPERLAPDIHNDPVEIQASSTKYTRLGFPINDSDKDLTLYVGEIGGNKEQIKLQLH